MVAIEADILVVGGGPAGSTTATLLAQQGWKVVLCEAETFPREHVGESLLPASIPILLKSGALAAVEAEGFLPKYGATMIWGSQTEPWSWYFRDASQRYPSSFQVVRSRFDQILLENAREYGVDVRESHRVLSINLDSDEYVEARVLPAERDNPEESFTLNARFLVDASGQNGLIARQENLREEDPFFRNLALYGYFSETARLPEPDSTNIFIESIETGWVWTIPLHTGDASVGVVVDSVVGSEKIRKMGAETYFRELLASAAYTSDLLVHADLKKGPFVVRDWSYMAKHFSGANYVLVGDAACFIDPLFSSGVHLALSSAVLASAYVSTSLDDSELGSASASVYEQNYRQQYDHFRELARLFYSSNRTAESYYWETRRLTAADKNIPAQLAFVRAVAGQPPNGYERAVLSHGEMPRVFSDAVSSFEKIREQRSAKFDMLVGNDDVLTDLNFDEKNITTMLDVIPKIPSNVSLVRKPILDEEKFIWGSAIETPHRPEGLPVSLLIVKLFDLINGSRNVRDILDEFEKNTDKQQFATVRQQVAFSLRLLYVDGCIDLLSGN